MRETLVTPAEAVALRLALDAAESFRGATSPNPPVGAAVLSQDGRLLGVGAHERAGQPHAEAGLLARLRDQGLLPGAHTLIVTLEPCNHQGRTPPCTRAILESPIRRVLYAEVDPNPRVLGGGARALHEAGLEVTRLAGAPEALQLRSRHLLGPFLKATTLGLPYVTLKRALDESGSMIPPAGRTTFTREPSLELAHALRRRADAILTGSGTILADSPQFTVRRLPDHPGKTRKLVILDRRGRVPAEYLEAAKDRGFEPWVRQDLEGALEELGRAGCLEVLVEAGPGISEAVLEQELWDEHVEIRRGPAEDRISTRRRS